jgi:CheY-like chemotaxis protein
MRAGAHAIVTHTNTLSSVVSDVYLRRELFSGLPGRRPEALPWDSLAANIEGFCRLRLAHRGLRTSVELQTSGIDSVQAASGALLGTAIRWILEQMGGWAQAGGLLSIRSSVHEGKLSLTFEACSVNVRGGGELFATEREEAQLEAFFRAGEGNYEVQPAPNLQTISRKVVLKLRSSAPSATRAPEGWCLFVDDNPQMTTFYARAAEALDIAAHIADTVAAARALILERGEPRLVVTDMQLPDGSGKEVVELIRRSFAKQVPVLVVSGEQLDLVREQLAGLLVWKFLVKPLSRAKLIGALQEVLATQESGVS